MRFIDLIRPFETPEIERSTYERCSTTEAIEAARADWFPRLVARTRMRLLGSEQPPPGPGRTLVIGIATYSDMDMRLLDMLADALNSDPSISDRVLLFEYDSFPTMGEREPWIPGLGFVYHTPVVGVWVDGVLTEVAQGYDARLRVRRMYGLVKRLWDDPQ